LERKRPSSRSRDPAKKIQKTPKKCRCGIGAVPENLGNVVNKNARKAGVKSRNISE
jgi:hypothetical protein